MSGEGQLFQVVGAACSSGRLPCRLHGRQEQAHERANDGDHDQQFHERKRTATPSPALISWRQHCVHGETPDEKKE
jgi:hypothetical protein